MKKSGILPALMALSFGLFSFAFAITVVEKFVVVKMSEPNLNYHWQNLNQIKVIIDQSNIPHNQAVYIVKSIDSLQKSIQATAKLDSMETPKSKK